MRKTLLPLGLLLAATGFSTSAAAALTEVPAGDIAGTVTWCDDEDTMLLQGAVTVTGSLTINAGCIVRGQPRDLPFGSPDPGAPGSLQIYQGGTITAIGTSSDPIIFTTAAVDTNDDGQPDLAVSGLPRKWVIGDGEGNFLDDTPKTNPLAPLDTAGNANVRLWGGITIAGFAPINLADVGFGDGVAQIEGTAAQLYGGTDPNDDSGDLQYLSVRHAGDEIGDGNELNGITFGGIGDGTTCDHIEIYLNQDDGVEYFGGTVECSNILVAYVGDDALDVDQGYTGTIQNAISLSAFFKNEDNTDFGSGGSGDNGGEWDGDDGTTYVGAPVSDVSFCNVTMLGNVSSEPGHTNPALFPASANRGITMRNGFGGALANSIVLNTTSDGIRIIAGGITPPCSGVPTAGDGVCGANCGVVGGDELIEVVSSTFSDVAAVGSCVDEAFLNGDDRGAGANLETAAEQLLNENPYWDPKGTLSGGRGKLMGTLGTPINPRAITVANDGIAPTDVGCPDGTATYRGATDAGASDPLFTDGWTAMSVGGVLPEPGAAPALGAGILVLWGLARRRARF